MRTEYKIVVGKPQLKRPRGRLRRREHTILKWILNESSVGISTGFNWNRM